MLFFAPRIRHSLFTSSAARTAMPAPATEAKNRHTLATTRRRQKLLIYRLAVSWCSINIAFRSDEVCLFVPFRVFVCDIDGCHEQSVCNSDVRMCTQTLYYMPIVRQASHKMLLYAWNNPSSCRRASHRPILCCDVNI